MSCLTEGKVCKGKLSPRVGKEQTVQNEAASEETGARIASSSASASTVIFKNTLVSPVNFNVLLQVPPVTLFLETAPVPQGTQGLSANSPAKIRPLERVANRSVPVPMVTTATMSQEAA